MCVQNNVPRCNRRRQGSSNSLRNSGQQNITECGLIKAGVRRGKQNGQLLFRLTLASGFAVVLSHGHLDHSGRLPKISAGWYKGPFYYWRTQPAEACWRCYSKDRHLFQRSDARMGKQNVVADRKGFDLNHVQQRRRGKRLNSSVMGIMCYGKRISIVEASMCVFETAGPYSRLSDWLNIHYRSGTREKNWFFQDDSWLTVTRVMSGPWSRRRADVLFAWIHYGDRNHPLWIETLEEFEDIK